MTQIEYPQTATAEIKLVVEIVRAGQVYERLDEFAKASWVVDGFIRRFLIGDPAAPELLIAGLPSKVTSDAEALDVLETLTGESDGRQRALSVPREIWQQLLSWLFAKLFEALGGTA